MPDLDNLPPVLTVAEVAKLLRLKQSTAYELIRTGRIPSIRLGRQVRIPTEELLEILRHKKTD